MLAGAGGGDGRVTVNGRGDDDGVDVSLIDQRLVVGEPLCVTRGDTSHTAVTRNPGNSVRNGRCIHWAISPHPTMPTFTILIRAPSIEKKQQISA